MSRKWHVVQEIGDMTFRVGESHDTEDQAHIAARELELHSDEEIDVFGDGPDDADAWV